MSSVVISGDTSGSVALTAPAVAGSNTITLPAATGTAQLIGVGTAWTYTSGTPTSIDFTGIPSWVKRITVTFSNLSTNGTSDILIQIGSGSVLNTGYVSASSTSAGSTTSTAGFIVTSATAAANTDFGIHFITLVTSNIWVLTGGLYRGSGSNNSSSGGVSLSGTLDRVRITTVNGTDAFDAGSINILYEG